MLQAERDRDAGLANNTAALEEFRKDLAVERDALKSIEATARNSFKGYRKWLRVLSQSEDGPRNDPAREQLLAELRDTLGKARGGLESFRRFFLLRLVRHPLLWLVLLAGIATIVPVLQHFGIQPAGNQATRIYIIVASVFVAIVLIRSVAKHRASALARSITEAVAKARRLHELGAEASEAHDQQQLARINSEYKSTTLRVDQELKQALSGGADLRARSRTSTDEKMFRVTARHDELHKSRLARLELEHTETVERLKNDAAASQRALVEGAEANETRFKAEHATQYQALENEWRSRTQPIYETLGATRATAEKLFSPWDARSWDNWTPPRQFEDAAKFGELKVDLKKAAEAAAGAQPPVTEGQSSFLVPLCLTYPDQGSLLFETGNSGREQAVGSLNSIILRLLSVAAPGRLNFTIIDPVGLGQHFAGVMHVADYEGQIMHSKIWTQSTQIEQRLG